MERSLIIALLMLVLGAASCTREDDTPVGDIRLAFTLHYDGAPIVFNQNCDYNGEFIRMTTFTYFISNIKLWSGSGAVNLKDIEMIDFSKSNVSDQGALEGFVLTIPGVRAGTYDALEFGVGVPKDMNATIPADYPNNSPLSDNGYYWVPWNSYFFSKMEGKFDALSTGTFESGFMFHTGLDENFKVVRFNNPIVINAGNGANVLHVSLDLSKLFVLNGKPINLHEINKAHWPMNKDVIIAITNNYTAAFKLDN
ncbi:MAG TPA: hypothetical protein PLC76_14110 [Saprospiraceae bacterium]|nr:hypothetical protein [Saprospiraceae bacterium]HRP85849.1 hypothetical protein [Saprospiraceae bacterium]